jgi:hypothetical protein
MGSRFRGSTATWVEKTTDCQKKKASRGRSKTTMPRAIGAHIWEVKNESDILCGSCYMDVYYNWKESGRGSGEGS